MWLRGFARELDGVARHAAPLDRPLQDALEHGHRLANRLDPDTGALELGPEPRDRLRREVTQPDLTEPRERVPVPQLRVDTEGRALEIGTGVDQPPLLDEFGECLGAGVEVGQSAAALECPQLGLERAGVGRAIEGLAALDAAFVTPARPPDEVRRSVAAPACSSLDHESLRVERSSPLIGLSSRN
jgi:hypothetical protein